MSELPCEVVKDLLPSYSDGMTSEKTNELVSEHAACCDSCRKALEAMRENENASSAKEKAELDFLKKNRRIGVNRAVIAACCAIILACSVLFLKLFIIGRDARYESLRTNIGVDGNRLSVAAEAADARRTVSKLVFTEEDGEVFVTARTVMKSLFHSGDRIERVFDSSSDIEAVTFNGSKLYEKGVFPSVFSDEMKQAVIDSWEDYKALPESERGQGMYPGYGARYFKTWKEAVDFIGFELADPLRSYPEFSERSYPEYLASDNNRTASLSWYGDEHGNISYVGLVKQYQYGNILVGFVAEPRCITIGADGSSGYISGLSPYLPDTSEGIVTEWNYAEDASTTKVIVMISDGVRYCIRLYDGTKIHTAELEAAAARVQTVLDEMLNRR